MSNATRAGDFKIALGAVVCIALGALACYWIVHPEPHTTTPAAVSSADSGDYVPLSFATLASFDYAPAALGGSKDSPRNLIPAPIKMFNGQNVAIEDS